MADLRRSSTESLTAKRDPGLFGRGIRLGFVGAGHWHFEVDARYLAHAREAGCQIVGLCDDDQVVARARADLAGCPWTTDPIDLVERFKPDLVVAMPRPDRGAEQVRALLELKVPIFAEKPLATRAEQLWPLVELAERGWLSVAFPNRLLPIWQRVETLAAEGRLGLLTQLGFRFFKGSAERYIDYGVPWTLDPTLSGGGPLRNLGIHAADLINQRLGPRAACVVGASLTHRMHQLRIEDSAMALMQTEDGVLASIEASYTHPAIDGNDLEMRVVTDSVYLIQKRGGLKTQWADGSHDIAVTPAGTDLYRDVFFDALRRFRRLAPPFATLQDLAMANEIVDGIYDRAKGKECR